MNKGETMNVASFLAEDIKDADITSETLLSEEKAQAVIIAKQDCVVAGLKEAIEIFQHFGLDVKSIILDVDNA